MATNKVMEQTRKKPGRSEIAKVQWEIATVTLEGKGLLGQVRTKEGLRFYALAIGPSGRYYPQIGRPFEGSTSAYRSGTEVDWSETASQALNELIQALWQDGWNPTTFGKSWYSASFRRPVAELSSQGAAE